MSKRHQEWKKKRKKDLGARQNWLCFYCRRQLSKATLTIDHIIPKSKGGGNHIDNMVGACFPCNNQRGNMDAGQFLALKTGSKTQKSPAPG